MHFYLMQIPQAAIHHPEMPTAHHWAVHIPLQEAAVHIPTFLPHLQEAKLHLQAMIHIRHHHPTGMTCHHIMRANTVRRIPTERYMTTEAWNHTRQDIQNTGNIRSIHIWTATETFMEPSMSAAEHMR